MNRVIYLLGLGGAIGLAMIVLDRLHSLAAQIVVLVP